MQWLSFLHVRCLAGVVWPLEAEAGKGRKDRHLVVLMERPAPTHDTQQASQQQHVTVIRAARPPRPPAPACCLLSWSCWLADSHGHDVHGQCLSEQLGVDAGQVLHVEGLVAVHADLTPVPDRHG